ncbi:BTAD domain-containing putative transcriptional regulator [Mycobacterium seoulense]|uniref:BTAD domain-containing putative transcriptional regulator n=1 Tax=Mycobacterium seoulense TaxID=386911 RepID=UPI003CE6A49F
MELGVLGPLQVRRDGAPVAIPGAKPRAILSMLGLHGGSVVAADTLVELLWGEHPPRTAAKALQTHISSLRRTLGDGFVLTAGAGWTLAEAEVDAARYKAAARLARDAAAAGDTGQAVARFEEALALWRGIPELPDGRRGTSEKTRWIEGHAALVEDRADALLATGRAAEIIGELEAAVAEAPLRERRWGQLMLALYRAGRQGEALGAYQRARALLAEELGVDPGPDLRRLEAAIVSQDSALEAPAAQQLSSVTRAVTFLLTDIEGSTAAWEANAEAMAVALARHDELVEQVVTSRGGRLIKTRGEGDATFSVFERPSSAAAAAIELQEAVVSEPWALREPMRVRVALHTGEVELRDGDYFGRAVNRAARLRSLASGGQILCSGATAELVIDSLPDDVMLADLGTRQLRNLARPEHVFELRLQAADEPRQADETDAPLPRPSLPAVLAGRGPFVGRGRELEQLSSAWQASLAGGANAMLIAGEPGVGKTRLAGEWARQAYDLGALVIYGRCDEDLGAPYQPFAEALRSLVPCLGGGGLRGLRGVEALLTLVPGLTDVVPDLAAPTRADPDTERYALFDAVVALLALASASAPVVLILDDLHWAAKPTLLLLRHLLRFGEHARVQVIGTYRSTDLDRSHPLAAMLADLHRDGTASRLSLSGLDEDDVTTYVAEAGYDDEELARALASVTGGNPFFLIEALRHVDESGGRWDQSTLPQGVREAVSRRLSRLPVEANKALAAAAVVGSRFALELVESVVGDDLVDAFDQACKAGIVIEEPGGRYRFNHAIVRQSLLAELPSVRRMRLHQHIAATLENEPGPDDERLAELAYHYFECAWAGNAAKAVLYCRRAADQAMARLAYEGAADLYDRALHALEEIDDELPDRDDQTAALLIARCEALLAAGDVASAASAVAELQGATVDSAQLAAWATCFDGQLSMLIHPERLDEVEAAVGAAADKLAELGDAAGEAKAHTVRAGCLARLGRIGDCEIALDEALTAARRAREHRRVNAVLGNAPLAALWGPNPVPRAGGRCLDVVRLLRITTDSPAVEATSTRCQAVLEAFRGRAAAARRMIESARRTVTELGLRHALLEVEQFAGIVELVVDEPAAAEQYLRKAYNGFRRMGLDADTAETAALLGRTCLALDRDAEADELCTESERLAGHALKASIAWRTLRARLLSRRGDHDQARRVAEEAVALAERTDALVDHGDACLGLATALGAAGDVAGARSAAERAVDLYERKGAVALAERARGLVGEQPPAAAPSNPPVVEPENACVRVGQRVVAAINTGSWDEFEQLFARAVPVESRRKIVGFTQADLPSDDWARENRRVLETDGLRITSVVIAVRGERLALARLAVGTADASPGAPADEFFSVYGIDEDGLIASQVWFDIDDVDAAMAELDAAHARFEDQHLDMHRLENAATRVDDQAFALFAESRWEEISALYADDMRHEDRRQGLRRSGTGRAAQMSNVRAIAASGNVKIATTPLALRGDRLSLSHTTFELRDAQPDGFQVETLQITEIDDGGVMVAQVVFDVDDFDAALAELDARYLAGEAATHANTWSVITEGFAAMNRRELPPTTPNWVNVDHRRATAVPAGEMTAYIRAAWDLEPDGKIYVEAVHKLNDCGAVLTFVMNGTSKSGFDAEWRSVEVLTVEGHSTRRLELFDEADLDAAIARFDQLSRPAPRLENTAARVFDHVWSHFATRDWEALGDTVADDFVGIDHRRVVSAETQLSRGDVVRDLRAAADVGFTISMVNAVAIRGERLVLARVRAAGQDPKAIENDALNVVEIDTDHRIANVVTYDMEDIDAAVAQLDARYLAGEAATYARTWSLVTEAFAALNQRRIPKTTPNWASMDHRRLAPIGAGDLGAYLLATWELSPRSRIYIEAVHRLDNLGAVITHVAIGTSPDGFDAEWRVTDVVMFDGDQISRSELFDETDLAAALERFEELSLPVPRLENAATQMHERLEGCFAARDWNAISRMLADDVVTDDRRRVVNSGVREGRDALLEEITAMPDIGVESFTSDVIATRGGRLALCRSQTWGRDKRPEAFHTDVLDIFEVNADGQVGARIVFDLNEFDAAIAELDARYIAGEAAAHARTWSAIAQSFASINRREMPVTTPDWVNIDHRRGTSIAPGEMAALMGAAWSTTSDLRCFIESVHRLNDLGAVITHVAHETSQDGFHAEWRVISVITVEGDMINRTEVFDEAELNAAIARFEQLSRPTPRLENTASRASERFLADFAACEWDAVAEALAKDFSQNDRRRVVGAGVRHGRDAEIADLQAIAQLGIVNVASTVIATRGEHLVLMRVGFSFRDRGPEAFLGEMLGISEINADERILAAVSFDLNDFDAAIAELDARYVAGEAAAHSRAWSVVASSYAALNRGEPPLTTPDCVNIDHRQETAFGPGDLIAYIRAGLALDPNNHVYVREVHRLDTLGAVVTYAAHETSQGGFDAEWSGIAVFTIEGDMINRTEVFDEAELNAAIARFDELSRPARLVENTASQVGERFLASFAASDWDVMAEMLDDDFVNDDRRRVVGAGVQHGRGAQIADMRTVADLWTAAVSTTIVATRGERLALMRLRFGDRSQGLDAFLTDAFGVLEINTDQRIAAAVFFDDDDADTAFAELDSRYIKGEAATHSRAWSVIVDGYAALNRRELPPTTPDFASIDHRRGTAYAPGELIEYVRAGWDLDQRIRTYPEVVHLLSDVGAVYTHVAHGTSHEGFDAERRGISLVTVDGEMVSRSEVFDEADIDAALARFEQLSRPAPRVENTATRIFERLYSYVAAGDWHAVAQITSEDVSVDDRRRVVNAGILHGRDANIKDAQATVDVGFTMAMVGALAIRGARLALTRVRVSGHDPEAIQNDALSIVEVDADERIIAVVVFDNGDVDAALQELEARYIAGEAAAYAHTWSVITGIYTMFNRHELPAVDWALVDHRRGTPFASGELTPALQTFFDLTAEFRVAIEAVHRLNKIGAVVTIDSQGSSRDGLAVEWRMIQLLTVEGDRLTRCELFDETDLDAAIEQFDQLSQPTLPPENAASRVVQQFLTHFAIHNWEAMAELIAGDFCSDDRRSVINAGIRRGRDIEMANWRATAEVWMSDVRAAVVATRGENLALLRFTFASQDSLPASFQAAALAVIEVNDDNRLGSTVVFDPDDIGAAFSELDARYLAGEAAACERTWSAIVEAYAAINRRQLPLMTTDFADIDHRRGAAWAPGELVDFLRSALDQTPDLTIRIAAVHRLNRQGAVVTHAANGTSPDGFDAEWREILFLIVDGDMLKHCEVFDETELNAALARFDELHTRPHRLDNAASQVSERFWDCLTTRDWTAMTGVLAENAVSHDNRRVVNSGVLRGRDINIANLRAVAEVGFERLVSTILAIRGQRLALTRIWSSAKGCEPGEISADMVGVVEIDRDNRMVVHSIFDADDFDAAVAELEARYIAGEAAEYAHTWSLVAQGHAQFNRHELPTMMPDVIYIDHRRSVTIEGADLAPSVRASWDLLPQVHVYVEAVHRLTELGAVATQVVKGTSQEGFDAEWQMITIFSFEGDRLSRYEVFDEAELDAALARFDELHQRPRRLENAASRAEDQLFARSAAGDWAAIAEILADDSLVEDRRRVVNVGVWDGRDSVMANMRALAEGLVQVTLTVIATRGERLALIRIRSFEPDSQRGEFVIELLGIAETDTDGQIAAHVFFDVDDADAAFDELDARYVAGEAATHARTWSIIAGSYAAMNRRELFPTTPDWVNVDHRRPGIFEEGGLNASLLSLWQLTTDLTFRIEAVHRLTDLGMVCSHVAHGISQDGFDAEWRGIEVQTVDGHLINRCEIFDEADLDAALARFDELTRGD